MPLIGYSQIKTVNQLHDIMPILLSQEKKYFFLFEQLDRLNQTRIDWELFYKKLDSKTVSLFYLTYYNSLNLFWQNIGLNQYRKQIIRYIQTYNKKLFSMVGPTHILEKINTELNLKYKKVIDYDYLCLTRQDFYKNMSAIKNRIRIHDEQLVFKTTSVNDFELLYPLQRQYEIEEVMLDQDCFSEISCQTNFTAILKKQKVFYLLRDGLPVAKANTNGQSDSIFQIGGMFTLPQYRSKGFAGFLFFHMLEELFLEKEHVILYVKKDNLSAINLYAKFCFKKFQDLSMIYYVQ